MKRRKTIGRKKRALNRTTRKHVYRGGVGNICPICHEQLTIQDDPQYKQYFDMLKVGVPTDEIKQTMTIEGKDPSIIDQDPNTPVGNIYTHPACGNKFHMDCIKQWCIGGERNDECPCPICRAPINHNDLDYTLEEKCQRKYNKLLKEHTELKEEYEELDEEHDKLIEEYNQLKDDATAEIEAIRLKYNEVVEKFNSNNKASRLEYIANDKMRVEKYNQLVQRYETLRLEYNALVDHCKTTE